MKNLSLSDLIAGWNYLIGVRNALNSTLNPSSYDNPKTMAQIHAQKALTEKRIEKFMQEIDRRFAELDK